MKLFDLLTAQRRFIYLAVALLSAAGIWAALRLPSAIYPELLFPRITVVAQGTSLGARQVVFSVTRPIEEAVSIVPGVQRVTSRSIRGSSEIQVYFAPNSDMQLALQRVQARVNQTRSQLPSEVELEVERLTPSVFPILSYNLEGGDPATLYDIARYQIRPVLSRIPGVGRVDVQGSEVREIEVIADPTRLAAQGMTYADLAQAIGSSIGTDAVGRVTRDYRQYLVVADQSARSASDVGNVVIGNGLRVRDVATVALGTEDRVSVIAGDDGRPAALLNITRQIGGNTVAIADSVAAVAAELSRALPPGVHLKAVYDQAALVREAVVSVRDAMLIGAALAVLILLVFLRHGRITAISATSIPLTLAITVFVMSRIGQTFNLMTLGAMAIAIGLVIDDAVVITENIVRHVRLAAAGAISGAGGPGHDVTRTRAIREAVHELIWPVTTSTLTTVVVFLPLGLLQGVVGQFFKALSITLTIAVLISLVLALTIIPLLAEQFLHVGDTEPGAGESGGRARGPLARFGRGIDGLADRYERSLGATLRHPRLVLGAAVVLVALGIIVHGFVGTGFLPEMDEGAFVLDYFTPGGTSLAESNRQLQIAERILAREPDVAGTSRRLGAELGLFATEQNSGDIAVRLKPRSERDRSSFEVIDDVRTKINSAVPRLHIEFVQILSDVINDLAGAAKPVEVKLFGERLDDLESYARSLEPKLQEVAGLEDFYNGVSEPSPEMMLRVNEAETNRIGLAPQQVGAAVSGALLGVQAGQVRLEDRAINVRVRAPDSVRYDPANLASLPVVDAATGVPAPLGSVASIVPAESRAELLRENQQQMIDMTADVSGRSLGAVMKDVKGILAANRPPSGIRVEVAGQYANQQESFRALLLVLALASVSVIAIMVIQFQSFIEPLVIVLAAPLSFVGAVTLLWITGTQLNVSSLMGLILLVGLIVKNGIILLDFTHVRMRDAGDPLEVAIRHAAHVRLRPILMTTLCTLFGLLPLALGLGAGSELQRPLALAVIGGLALSTPITLYVVPTFLVAVRGTDYTLDERSSARSPSAQPQLDIPWENTMRHSTIGRLARTLLASGSALAISVCVTTRAAAQTPSYHVVATYQLGGDGGWDYIALDSAHNRLFVARSDRIMVVDPDKGTLIGEIPGFDRAHGIAFSYATGHGFATSGADSTVTMFDLATLKVLGLTLVDADDDAILYDPASTHIFTMNGDAHTASVIDAASGKRIGTIPLGGQPEFAVSDGAGEVYVNLEDKGAIVELDPKAMKVTRRWSIAPCESPTGLAMDVAHERLFSVCRNRIMAISDARAGKLDTTVPIGSGVDGARFDPATGDAFASNGEGSLTVVHEVSPDRFQVVQTAPTISGARTMELDPRNHRVYVVGAKFGEAPTQPTVSNPRRRPPMVPGSFTLLVLAR